MGTKLSAVKLTASEREALDQLVQRGEFETVSAAIRAGIMLLLNQHHLSPDGACLIRCERIRHPMRKRRKGSAEE